MCEGSAAAQHTWSAAAYQITTRRPARPLETKHWGRTVFSMQRKQSERSSFVVTMKNDTSTIVGHVLGQYLLFVSVQMQILS